MSDSHAQAPAQLGFDALLVDADTENRARKFERETAHLPDTMEEGLRFYRILLRQHHAAMLDANVDETMRLREEARNLALRLNGGEPGILAGPDSPGHVLERETAATPDKLPLWGQIGSYAINVSDLKVHIALDGIFGIGGSTFYWPGFSTRAVECDRPFLSSTGYRSFLGVQGDPVPGLSPDTFTRRVIESYIAHDLKGSLVSIEPKYRQRAGA
ncbi:MAG: hypothetical protein AB2653_15100 [Candidatus Thiodiazotropha endolucinida]